MFEWLADPFPIALLAGLGVFALVAGVVRRWRPWPIAMSVAGSVLILFSFMWSYEFGRDAFWLVGTSGIGMWLAQRAIDRARVEGASAAERRS